MHSQYASSISASRIPPGIASSTHHPITHPTIRPHNITLNNSLTPALSLIYIFDVAIHFERSHHISHHQVASAHLHTTHVMPQQPPAPMHTHTHHTHTPLQQPHVPTHPLLCRHTARVFGWSSCTLHVLISSCDDLTPHLRNQANASSQSRHRVFPNTRVLTPSPALLDDRQHFLASTSGARLTQPEHEVLHHRYVRRYVSS